MVLGHWLVVAASFAVIEIAVPAMVCIWLAAAALGTALIVWLAPGLSWEHQALIFAALAVASVAIGRLAFGRPIVDGRGRLRVDDTMWLVDGPDLPAGTRVQVTGVDNTMLRVTEL